MSSNVQLSENLSFDIGSTKRVLWVYSVLAVIGRD